MSVKESPEPLLELKLHTDEYEISIGREISLCQRRIRQLEKAILKKEEKHGMTTEAFLRQHEQSGADGANREFSRWASDSRDLRFWKKMLKDYEAALQTVKQA